MIKEMTLTQLKKSQPQLIRALLADYPENRAVQLANTILKSLDDVLEEEHIVTRTNSHYEVQKNESLAERIKAKVRSVAGLK